VTPTRQELITLCNRGVVPQTHWHNRDSAGAQIQLATARTLLLAGCEFRLDDTEPTISDKNTWWIEVTYKGFNYFEEGELSTKLFYVPTDVRLIQTAGKDWY